jgi:hypothetical protein
MASTAQQEVAQTSQKALEKASAKGESRASTTIHSCCSLPLFCVKKTKKKPVERQKECRFIDNNYRKFVKFH